MSSPDFLLVRELSVLDSTSPLFDHPVLADLEKNGYFSNRHFTFVGVYYHASTGITVIGYPKYLPKYIENSNKSAVISHVNLICQVVEQARPYLKNSLADSSYTFSAYNANLQMQHVNRYNLAELILQDYMNRGIYYSETSHVLRNGNGAIQWQHTIQKTAPIIDKSIVYLDTFHYHTKQDYSQLVTHLHVWIVLQCARIMQGIGQYQELELPECRRKFDEDDLSQYVSYLIGKLNSVFSDREVRLMKALASWCGESAFYRSQMGVTAFDKIWEYATKKVFGNIDDTRSGPPSYFLEDGEFFSRGDAIPDILRVFKHKECNCNVIGILDAKYYCPECDIKTRNISGAPTNADITKQIGYYRYMKQLYPQNNIKFTNAFLLPSKKMDHEILFKLNGYACPNRERYKEINKLFDNEIFLPPARQDKVLIYSVNPEALYQACLNDAKVDDVSFYNSFIVPFENE